MPIFQKSPEKSVTRMLKRLDQAMALVVGPMYESRDSDPMVGVFKVLREDLEKMKKDLAGANRWEKYIISRYQVLEKRVHIFYDAAQSHNNNSNNEAESESEAETLNSKLKLLAKSAKDLRDSISGVQLPDEDDSSPETADSKAYFKSKEPPRAWKMSQDWLKLRVEHQILVSPAMECLRSCYVNLENLQTRLCLLCFSIFPDNAVLKKRLLIYWWIGEGIITASGNKTAEEVGDAKFDQLASENILVAVKDTPSSPIVNRYKMNPWIRDMLVSLAREAGFFDFDSSGTPSHSFSNSRRRCLLLGSCSSTGGSDRGHSQEKDLLSVFNVSEEVLAFGTDWLSKMEKIEVLQLGRWQYWFAHHIEIQNDEQLFKGLGKQKLLKCLSLRGISTVFTLPSSISGLVNLEILDLKACHNLEKLPDLSLLKKLTHLDMSECYLLEAMPKGIAKLTSLQVLKGFVIGNSTRNTSKFSDLAKLKNLKRLSIYLGRNAVVEADEGAALKEILSLRCLTIGWGATTKEPLSFPLSLPKSLKKLDLRGFPVDKAPVWLKPSGLKLLEKLYIRGGELKSLEIGQGEITERWTVEILRLKFMRKFEMGLGELRQTFTNLRYLEKIDCCGKNIVWSKDADEEDEDILRPEVETEVGEITSIP